MSTGQLSRGEPCTDPLDDEGNKQEPGGPKKRRRLSRFPTDQAEPAGGQDTRGPRDQSAPEEANPGESGQEAYSGANAAWTVCAVYKPRLRVRELVVVGKLRIPGLQKTRGIIASSNVI